MVASVDAFQELLSELRGSNFVESACVIGEVRLVPFFKRQPLVARLVRVIESMANARTVIDPTLDSLFKELRKGEMFGHAETVMAILWALSRADDDVYFKEVATVFADSRTAELGRLRRFAILLLAKQHTKLHENQTRRAQE